MSTILALDLSKFKTVARWYDVGEARFQTTLSNRSELRELITREAREELSVSARSFVYSSAGVGPGPRMSVTNE
jgi:hypothetical protein